MSAALCTVCLDTGSKSQDIGGDLDCTACTAADDRSGLRWLLALRPSEDDSDVWRAYQLGKAAAQPQEDIERPTDYDIIMMACEIALQDDVWEINDADLIPFVRRCIAAASPVVPVAAQPVVPEGWRMVPVEPTIAMIAALGWGGDEVLAIGHAMMSSGIADEYAAMLAAAPQPAASVTDVAKDAQSGCTHEMLKAAMKVAVQHKIIPSHSFEETYLKNWNGMKAAIDAAIAAQQGEKT